MDRTTAPRKTALARTWLDHRDPRLERAHRFLLITVDGRKTAAELRKLAASLMLSPTALDELQRQGLIEWPASAAPAPAPRVPTPPVAAPPSVAAVKMYAMDLATLMLGGRDQAVRAEAVRVQTRDELIDWCHRTARAVEAQAGAERAQRFLEKTSGMLEPVP